MTVNIVLSNESLNKWCNTQGINYYEGKEALGNLFAHAVPKALHILFENGGSVKDAYSKLFKLWLDNWALGMSFEDALFWAIYKATGLEE